MFYTDTFFLLLFAGVWALTRLLRPWPAIKEWFLIFFSLFVIASWGYLHDDEPVALAAINGSFAFYLWQIVNRDVVNFPRDDDALAIDPLGPRRECANFPASISMGWFQHCRLR